MLCGKYCEKDVEGSKPLPMVWLGVPLGTNLNYGTNIVPVW